MNNDESKEKMLKRITVQEFRDSGLLWYINQQLHCFGLAIVADTDNNTLYPARCKFKGFSEYVQDKNMKKIVEYMQNNADDIINDFDHKLDINVKDVQDWMDIHPELIFNISRIEYSTTNSKNINVFIFTKNGFVKSKFAYNILLSDDDPRTDKDISEVLNGRKEDKFDCTNGYLYIFNYDDMKHIVEYNNDGTIMHVFRCQLPLRKIEDNKVLTVRSYSINCTPSNTEDPLINDKAIRITFDADHNEYCTKSNIILIMGEEFDYDLCSSKLSTWLDCDIDARDDFVMITKTNKLCQFKQYYNNNTDLSAIYIDNSLKYLVPGNLKNNDEE